MAAPLIGLTGGMGAGKSTALAELQGLGAEVLSTDAVVHELYADERVRHAVRERWGADVIAADGSVDRAAVAGIVFERPAEREWLEGVLWPLVGERVAAWAEHVRSMRPPPRAGVLEVPLLFESGLDGFCDATIAVVADEGKIEERTAGRGLVGVAARSGRQLTQAEKAQRARFVVVNDGSVEDLQQRLAEVLAQL